VKRQPMEWEKTFANHAKELVFRKYKEFLQQKNINPIFKWLKDRNK
jgi:hypothetical protein